MNKKIILMTALIVMQGIVHAEPAKTVLNQESFELSMINSQHSNGNYSKGRGIFVGFSAPVYVTEYGITSLAIDGGYGNLGTIEGEDNLGDPYSLRMGIVQLGLRGTGMLTNHISAFAKASIARVNVDSTELGKDINVEGQLAAGLEWHLPKGLAFNLTYSQITDDVTSVMVSMSIS